MVIGAMIGAAALVGLASCGGSKTATKPTPARPATEPPTPTPDASAPSPAPSPSPPALSVDACNKLVDHVVQIAFVAHAQKEDPKYHPTKAQLEQIRAKLRAELGPACRGFSQEVYNCVLAATDRASYAACGRVAGSPAGTKVSPRNP